MNGLYNSCGVMNKNELWDKYGYLVRQEALKLQVRLPPSIELDDLIQVGAIGLFSAIDDFDPKKGINVPVYIKQRIRWALIDGLRERDWVPRRVRSNSREITKVIQHLEQEKGEAVTEAEVADAIGIPIQKYHSMLAETNVSQIYSLDELQEEFSGNVEQIDAENEKLNPLDEVMLNNLTEKISKEIRLLPERERLLLNFYYQQDLNMKEIGVLLDITEARVSQLHSQALKFLRARLDNE